MQRTYVRTYGTYVSTYVRTYVRMCVRTYVRMYVRTRECKRTYVRTYVRMYVRTDGRACVRTYVRKPTCTYAPTTLCGTHMITYVRAQSIRTQLFHIATVRTHGTYVPQWPLAIVPTPMHGIRSTGWHPGWSPAHHRPASWLIRRLTCPSPGGRGSSCGGSCPFCSRASTPLCTSSALREKQAQRPP